MQLKYKFITINDFGDEDEYKSFFEKVDLLTLSGFDRLEKEGHIASLKKVRSSQP